MKVKRMIVLNNKDRMKAMHLAKELESVATSDIYTDAPECRSQVRVAQRVILMAARQFNEIAGS